MLHNIGLKFEGRLHCGRDDADNLARVVQRLLEDGATLQVNEKLHAGRITLVLSFFAPELRTKAKNVPEEVGAYSLARILVNLQDATMACLKKSKACSPVLPTLSQAATKLLIYSGLERALIHPGFLKGLLIGSFNDRLCSM